MPSLLVSLQLSEVGGWGLKGFYLAGLLLMTQLHGLSAVQDLQASLNAVVHKGVVEIIADNLKQNARGRSEAS